MENKYISYINLVFKEFITLLFEICNIIFQMLLKMLIHANSESVLKQRNSFLQLPFLSNK